MTRVPHSQHDISFLLRERIAAGDFPSAIYCIAEGGRAIFADALGEAAREPERHPATLQTVYDLASLTKPFVTGLLCARFLEQGRLELDRPVANYLNEFDLADRNQITIRHLLTHTSGLPAWRPLYLLAKDKADALSAIANEPLQQKPGERVVYSDLGFMVLGFLLQRLTAMEFATLARHQIIEPLGLNHAFFNPGMAARTGIAACETGNAYERGMCEKDFPSEANTTWRSELIWGEVHDGNAHFLGGAAGHAGLFANVTDALQIANQFIGGLSKLLSRETCQLFRENMTSGLNEARSFAWQLAATPDSTAGAALPPDAFGHTGFTGTSCWVDGARQRVFLLFTNRTHARKLPFANINPVRRQFHSLAVKALAESVKE